MMAILEGDVVAGIAPLVRTTVAELMGEVVMVEVNAVDVVVVMFSVCLTIHEDLHWFTTMFKPRHEEDATNGNTHHDQLHTRRQQAVGKVFHHVAEGHSLEAILRVEVLLRVDGWVVDTTDHPRWTVQRADNTFGNAVRATHPTMRSHSLLTRQRERVQVDWSDWPMTTK